MYKRQIQDIIAGPTYGFGLSNTGKIYSWGYTRVSDSIDMKDIPAELTDGSVDIAFLAAGSDHAVAIDTENNFYFWGNTRLRQDQYESNSELNMALRRGDLEIKQLEAGNQFSIILDTAGNVYLWGNPSGNELDCRDKERIEEGEDKEPRQYQGNIEKVAVTDHSYIDVYKRQMWYSTVKLLEIGTFAMQWITAGGAPVFPSRLRFFIRQLA